VSTCIRRLAFILLTLLAAMAPLAAAGCGSTEERSSGAEGEFVHVDDTLYQVQLTRLLNPRQRPDDVLLTGQPPPARMETYLAVFVRIENKGSKPYSPPRDMKVIDTVGNQYLPLDATRSGFGLDFGHPIDPGSQAPPPNSPAAEGPDASSMILFRVRLQSATDNLPLVLEVPGAGKTPSRIKLDV
jgi:hypothetical protein